jgi:hypothetical protein
MRLSKSHICLSVYGGATQASAPNHKIGACRPMYEANKDPDVRIKSLVLIGGRVHFHRSKACTLLQVKQIVPNHQNVAPKVAHIPTIVPFQLTSKN